ncbi:MAG TPA: Crp/Fnr family transcriptional regulator [Terriglobales bacterium]|nr:Crp/Fnr family transcriptional regulator [Terriglobales bacterium]
MGNMVVGAHQENAPVDTKGAPAAMNGNRPGAEWESFLTGISKGKTILEYGANDTIFTQGAPADSVLFLLRGRVKLAVISREGKEAIVSTLGVGELFGEGCLAGQAVRIATAISVEAGTRVARVEKPVMARMLHEKQGLAELLIAHLLSRNIRYEADLVDQLFNSSEKRLARMLLLLSHFEKDSQTETVVPGITHEHLAQMIGTTRSRINFFMNKFRDLGFIDYNSHQITVHRGLSSVTRNA